MDAICHRSGWDIRDIKDQVPNLPIEDICGSILQPAICVRVAINHSESLEIARGFEHRQAVRVAYNLGVVVVNDGRRNEVRSGREVNHGGSRGGGSAAPRGASTTKADGRTDCIGIVGEAIAYLTSELASSGRALHTFCAEILNVPEHLVGPRSRIEGRDALVLDLFEPVRARRPTARRLRVFCHRCRWQDCRCCMFRMNVESRRRDM